MSWLSRLFRRAPTPVAPRSGATVSAPSGAQPRPPRPAPAAVDPRATPEPAARTAAGHEAPPERPDWLVRLERLGQPGGADTAEAVMRLRQLDGAAEQTRALHALLGALGPEPALEPVRVACAGLLVDRGEREQALGLLSPCRSVPAMMLAAELYAGAGQLARATSTIERVLARAIDTPGARERHQQWCEALGRSARPAAPTADAGATVLAPQQAGAPYRLVREVARGGAGTVYEAEDELLGRRIAFKVYHRPDQEKTQLLREARMAARVAGPGVVRVYDANPDDGWVALEWIARGSLRDALQRETRSLLLPIERWLVPLVAALGRVHQAGLVHADIKPANVLLRSGAEPVLGDFGLCRRRGEPSGAGTPGYLSPERLEGAVADPRDDVYAVGRILEDALAMLEGGAAAAGAGADATGSCEHLAPSELARYAAITRACLGPAASRPADAQALLRWLTEGATG